MAAARRSRNDCRRQTSEVSLMHISPAAAVLTFLGLVFLYLLVAAYRA